MNLATHEPAKPVQRVQVRRSNQIAPRSDTVIGEEPLEIRVQPVGGDAEQLAITMRTPGNDVELAAGFLWAEGLLRDRSDLISVAACADARLSPRERANVVVCTVAPGAPAVQRTLQRRFTVSSACGVCGADQIADLAQRCPNRLAPPALPLHQLAALPEQLASRQPLFRRTGGVHAAALVDPTGTVIVVREDVGRHNAVDKVIGFALVHDRLPLSGWSLVVSGRGGFEIVHKAVAGRISALVSVSAPTSLAVETARRFGLTLLGFARDGVATIYSE